ncbi:hypothetical protein RJZ56_002032 [Blastomyces dermatitidis]|uniref:Uncharacterized protein n=2 Tax=Ajellomyces dermatitidis TaxID=5039 RepID=F2TMQ9_AJEDA|nr:uncharacterized protein BDCG_07879 [Blastomyces dermatitidis ER-3]EEQ84610.1 hypothetical protein BDCG_07879 [Blastomyces dermatitidis ER-3]EGE84522.1 hypothetical protein BDDG_07467 [Blastomyces dermatitidis ATCC 18188]EQL30172.1 hypothetical protein BDFG_07354 [Blastomyces dermatitidis ATCC 26199]
MGQKTPIVSLFLLLLLLLSLTVSAADNITDNTSCPPNEDIVYSPFKPWFHFYSGSNQLCWITSICALESADEARKQQFGATALIMGLIPLTLKDVAWPERRIALVSAPLPFAAAVIVRALGLEPTVVGDLDGVHVQRYLQWMEGAMFANVGLRPSIWTTVRVAASFLLLVVSYGVLAVVEIYSKRSSLGCPYPVFAVTWCIAGVFPAFVHALFAMRRTQVKGGSDSLTTGSVSAVQGADEAWPVQLAWGIYYVAGTLVFTSIMAVTVVELTVWVFVQTAVTAASKVFALYLCLLLRNPDAAARQIRSDEE